jgi:hypothetical protein
VHDFVPAGYLWRFVVTLVTEALDFSAIMASYKGEKGQPPYHPAMMVSLLLRRDKWVGSSSSFVAHHLSASL